MLWHVSAAFFPKMCQLIENGRKLERRVDEYARLVTEESLDALKSHLLNSHPFPDFPVWLLPEANIAQSLLRTGREAPSRGAP